MHELHWDSGGGPWERGDFTPSGILTTASGRIRQTANPYSIDSVLRILHTLLLAEEGASLVPCCEVPCGNGRAFYLRGPRARGENDHCGFCSARCHAAH